MNLFRLGQFKLHSGGLTNFKICCDALVAEDWDALAMLVAQDVVPTAREIVGIPTGGTAFAKALENYVLPDDTGPKLVADDVITTGESFRPYWEPDTIGVVAFSRGPSPLRWVWPIFSMGEAHI